MQVITMVNSVLAALFDDIANPGIIILKCKEIIATLDNLQVCSTLEWKNRCEKILNACLAI